MKLWKKIVLAALATLVLLVVAGGVGFWLYTRHLTSDTRAYLEMSEDELLAAIAEDPTAPDPHEYLGLFYQRKAKGCPSEDDQVELYRKSYAQLQESYRLTSDWTKRYLLEKLGWAAYRSGNKATAKKYATMMTKDSTGDWNHGNAIHHGHTLLGLLALDRGDLTTAKSELALAGKTPGSPQLNSFGPQMSLAKALLEKGEKEAVIAYFDACDKFWKMDWGKLKKWAKEARDGKTPDFGANLHY